MVKNFTKEVYIYVYKVLGKLKQNTGNSVYQYVLLLNLTNGNVIFTITAIGEGLIMDL